jgi:pimeloyl-ACP methyl ester carboxylesterase
VSLSFRAFFLITFLISVNLHAGSGCLVESRHNITLKRALERLEEIKQEEHRLGVSDREKTESMLHQKSGSVEKTGLSFVVYHGLAKSPRYTKRLAEALFESGNNVINVRLAKHAESQRSSLDRVKYEEWFRQADEFVGIASALGDRVVYVGHSTGGLLALYSVLMRSEGVAGVILLSTALELQNSVVWKVRTRWLGLSGYVLDFVKKANALLRGKSEVNLGDYQSSFAGHQVKMAAMKLLSLLEVRSRAAKTPEEDVLFNKPVLAIDTASDAVVVPVRNQEFVQGLNNGRHILVPDESAVSHSAILNPSRESESDRVFGGIFQFVNSL